MNRIRLILINILIICSIGLLVSLIHNDARDYMRFNHIIFLRNTSNPRQAIDEFERYFKNKDLSEKQLAVMVDLFVQAHDFQHAEEFSRLLIKKNNLEPEYFFNLAIIKHLQGDYDYAFNNFLAFLELTNSGLTESQPEEVLLAEIYCFWRQKDWTHLINISQSSPLLDEQEMKKRSWRKTIYNQYIFSLLYTCTGAAYCNMQQYATANVLLTRSLSFRETEPLSHFYLGVSHCFLGDYNLGEYHLAVAKNLIPAQKSLDWNQLFSFTLFALKEREIKPAVRSLLFLEQYEPAASIIDSITTYPATAADYYYVSGNLAEAQNDWRSAYTSYTASLVYDPQQYDLLARLMLYTDINALTQDYSGIQTIIEVENLGKKGIFEIVGDFIVLSRTDNHILIPLSQAVTASQNNTMITLSIIGKSTIRNNMGALILVSLNNAPVSYLYFPSQDWDIRTITIPHDRYINDIKISFVNNFIAALDQLSDTEDRNFYIDKILVFD